MPIPLEWRASITGAEDVKTKLQELKSQYDSGGISLDEYRQKGTILNRDVRFLTNSFNIQRNTFLAMHPVINNLSRAMSIFGSVLHAASSAMTLINTAGILMNTNTAAVAQATADAAQAQREYDEAVLKFGPDSKKAIEALDKLRVALVRQREEVTNAKNQTNQYWLSLIIGIGQVVTAFALAGPKILTAISNLKTNIKGIGALAIGVTIGALVFPSLDEWLRGQSEFYKNWAEFRDKLGAEWVDFFLVGIPDMFRKAVPLWMTGVRNIFNGIISLWNQFGSLWVSGVNALAKSIVDFINNIIRSINAIGHGVVKIPLLPAPKPLIFTPVGALGGGGSTNPSGISSQTNPGIVPRTTSGGGGSTIVQNIIVQGSILTENDIKKAFDKWLKDGLKTVGFS